MVVSAVRTHHVLTRDSVTAMSGKTERQPSRVLLEKLDRFAEGLRAKREAEGAMQPSSIAEPQVAAVNGELAVAATDPEDPLSKMAEELAIFARVSVGRYCLDRGLPAIFESQRDAENRQDLEAILHPVVRRHEIRRQTPPLTFATDPEHHHSLGISGLACVTNPLGRYPDLLVQRQVVRHILHGEQTYRPELLRVVCYRAREELAGMEVFRQQRVRQQVLRHLSGAVHQPLTAVVLHLRHDGALVELVDYPLKTVVHAGGAVCVGEEVTVQLSGVDLWKSKAYGSIVR